MEVVRRRQLKRSSLSEAVTKKDRHVFSSKKIGLHPSVAAPGDTNPSDATGHLLCCTCSKANAYHSQCCLTSSSLQARS